MAPQKPALTMGPRQWGLILILSVIWGGSFFFIGIAVKELPPFTIVFCRVGIAAAILVAVVKFKGLKMPGSLSVWGAFFVMGTLNNMIPFCLIVWGQTHIPSGLASILNGTTPIFSAILAHLLTREEPLTWQRTAGVIIGWTGVVVLIGPDALSAGDAKVLGQLAVLAAAFFYALGAIYGRRFKDISPLIVAAGMLCASTVMMAPMVLFFEAPWQLSPGPTTLAALLGLSALCTSLAYLIYFRVLATAGSTNLLLVTFLIPVSAILLGALFLDERLEYQAFLGMGVIFGGLLLMDGRILSGFKRKKTSQNL